MSREAGLFQALTATDRLSDLLPVLHHHAVSAVGGRSAILFQYSRGGDVLQATSAFGLDALPPDAWPARLVPDGLFRNGPQLVDDVSRAVPGAGGVLGRGPAVLVPLAQGPDAMGVLVIGCDARPSARQIRCAASVGHAFVIALERARVASALDLQDQLKALLQAFTRDGSNAPLADRLEALCGGANRLFGADRTSVWLHDRRARTLVLSASSDVAYLAASRRVAASDPHEPAALGMRRERAGLAPTRADPAGGLLATLTIPLKGRRRALGTMVLEEVRLEPGTQMDLVERADEMGRQLSSAIENVLLLDDVLRSRRELENAFNSLADLVAVADEEGRLAYTNLAFLDRIGRSRADVIDRPIAEVVGPATKQLIARTMGLGHSGSDPLAYHEGQTPSIVSAEVDDTILRGTFHVTLSPLVGEQREPMGIVLVARDITAHARLEAERTELRNRLGQSEKLAALGQFVAGIAHELNNPLQGVLGHLELLRATGAFPKGLRRDMQRIYREADRAAKIVRNLLVFAGSRRLVRRRTSINAALSRVLALRAPAFRAAGIEVVRRHEEGLPRIQADPLLVQQAMLNIVLNAEQAIGAGGGRIESRTSVRDGGGARHVVVEIRDTGPGIPATAMPRVFEPFFTTKEVGQGTGLGLAITYGIIQEHGGHISASNHPGGGAVFTVHLPVDNE